VLCSRLKTSAEPSTRPKSDSGAFLARHGRTYPWVIVLAVVVHDVSERMVPALCGRTQGKPTESERPLLDSL